MAGITPTGFDTKTLSEIRDELEADVRAAFGISLLLGDSTLFGKLLGIDAAQASELWEALEAVYSSQNPDEATGEALDALCALTGTFRKATAPSTVLLTLTGTDTTVISAGSQASTLSLGDVFQTLADATLLELPAWVTATVYAIGDRVSNDSNSYVCTVSGTSAGGPTGEGTAIVDGTVTWLFLGDGTAAADVEAESFETGPIPAVSGDITEIETPVAGWDSTVNLLDADLGNVLESDEDLRVRRELELSRGGVATIDAIIADLLDVEGVTTVGLFVNNTDLTDADGVPPHSVEALVQGGEDQDIWDGLLASVAAGIGTHGTLVGTAVDSQGADHTMAFSRPADVEIYVAIELIYDATLYVPSTGDDLVKQAIVDFGDARGAGLDAVSSAIKGACFDVPGVLDVTLAAIDTAPAPTLETTIPISTRELALYDTSRITVTPTEGTP